MLLCLPDGIHLQECNESEKSGEAFIAGITTIFPVKACKLSIGYCRENDFRKTVLFTALQKFYNLEKFTLVNSLESQRISL